MVVIGKKGLFSGKMVVLGQKCLYSGKIVFLGKVVVKGTWLRSVFAEL